MRHPAALGRAENRSPALRAFAVQAVRSGCSQRRSRTLHPASRGGVAERSKAAVLKTVGRSRVPGVRIPPPPPLLISRRAGASGGAAWWAGTQWRALRLAFKPPCRPPPSFGGEATTISAAPVALSCDNALVGAVFGDGNLANNDPACVDFIESLPVDPVPRARCGAADVSGRDASAASASVGEAPVSVRTVAVALANIRRHQDVNKGGN